MKRNSVSFLAIAFLFVATQLALGAERDLQVGGDLSKYIRENPPKFGGPSHSISRWVESRISFYKYKETNDAKDQIVMVANNIFPIGVIQWEFGLNYYLYDLNGDGILDAKTYTALVLPYWVVEKCSPNKTSHDNVSPYFDGIYDLFQADENPYQNNSLAKAILKLDDFAEDQHLENRDLIYDLLFYTLYNQEFLRPSLELMEYMAGEYEARFGGRVHPLIYLHTAETLINLNHLDKAKVYIDLLLEQDPDYIPALAYAYRLEDDWAKAAEMLKKLKAEHTNHWIVRQL